MRWRLCGCWQSVGKDNRCVTGEKIHFGKHNRQHQALLLTPTTISSAIIDTNLSIKNHHLLRF